MTEMIEQEVPSLELCREMKKLGFPQDGIWYWYHYEQDHLLPKSHPSIEWMLERPNLQAGGPVMAPTVAQMLQWIPKEMTYKDTWCAFALYHDGCGYYAQEYESAVEEKGSPNQSIAKMLIHLAKQGHINPKELR